MPDEVVVDLGAIASFPFGLKRLWPRVLTVGANGNVDFATITEAVTYAASQQTAAYERWAVLLMPGVYNENVNILREVHILGSGQSCTSITGNVILHADSTIHRCSITATTGACALDIVLDVNVNVAVVRDCYIVHSLTTDNPSIAVRISGSATGGQVVIANSYLYPQANSNTANAWAVGVHVASTVAGYTEVYGGHIKTSSRANGGACPVWNEAASPSATNRVYVEAPWKPSRTDGGTLRIERNNGSGVEFLGDVMPTTGGVGTSATVSKGSATVARYRFAEDMDVSGLFYSAATWQKPMWLRSRAYWIDDAGRLRFKATASSAPASDTDGAYVGATPSVRKTGKVYGPAFATGKGTIALTLNTMRTVRFEVRNPGTQFVEIGTDVTFATGGAVARYLIYKDDGTGYPGVLDTDAGTVTVAGGYLPKAITFTPTTAGTYHLAVGCQGATFTIRSCTNSDPEVPQPTNSSAVANGFVSSVYDPLTAPSPFPYSAETASAPFVYLKMA